MDDDDDGGGFNDEDVQQHEQLQCTECGGRHFFNEAGLYFCSDCNTQSQQFRQVIEEDLTLRAGNIRQALQTRDEKKAGASAAGQCELKSTWEIYNLVLRAMTEQLVNIGFPPLLRDKVFQIWTAYLIKREVLLPNATKAEVMSDDEAQGPPPTVKLPAVVPGESKMNLFVFNYAKQSYNRMKMIRKKNASKLSLDERRLDYSARVFKRLKTAERKKAFEQELYSQTAEEGGESSKAKSDQKSQNRLDIIPPRYTRPATVLRKIYNRTRITYPLKINYEAKKSRVPKAVGVIKRLLDVEVMSFHTVLLILFISLRQIGCKVLFTDIIRLIKDGTLWVENIKDLIGEDEFAQLNKKTNVHTLVVRMVNNPYNCLVLIDQFLLYIGLRQFQFPTFEEFLPKFIDELALPKEFETLLLEMNKLFSMDTDLKDDVLSPERKKFRYLVEIPTLARIGMMLRMLFGFDDETEKHQSRFAQIVNGIMDVLLESKVKEGEDVGQASASWNKLFVLEDWFNFIRYRKFIVQAEMFNSKLYTPNCQPNLIQLKDIIQKFGVTLESLPKLKARASLRSFFSETVEQVHGEIQTTPSYITIHTATDQVFQQYLKAKPNVAHPEFNNEKLLNMKFDKTRIDWVWNPEKYIPLLHSRGYEVKIIAGDASNYEGSLEFQDNLLYLFKPYCKFDHFVCHNNLSASMKFLAETLEDAVGVEVDGGDVLVKLISNISRIYCMRSLNNMIPLKF